LFEQAHPLFVRKEDGSEVEVRGAKNRIKKFSKTFTDSDGVDRIERSQTTQPVIDGLASIFNDEIEALTLTEVEFQRTYLLMDPHFPSATLQEFVTTSTRKLSFRNWSIYKASPNSPISNLTTIRLGRRLS